MPRRVADGLTEEHDNGVLTWTLDAPHRRNAVHPEALTYIAQQCPTLCGAIVVLRGAGDEAFCAGFDLRALANPAPPASDPAEETALPDATLIAATRAMRASDGTFVAAIGGYAIGAGVELACACDIRVAKQGVWFEVPAARLGVVYHADGLALMHRVFGDAGVRQLLLLGRRLDAQRVLHAGGLVDVVPPKAFDAAIDGVLADLRAAAPLSLAANRTLLRALDAPGLDTQVRRSHDHARAAAYASAEQLAPRARG